MVLVSVKKMILAAVAALALLAGADCVAQERAFVGLQVQAMSPEAAQALGWTETKGVLVRDVALGGPGALAGFAPGDIIVGFDGRAVPDLNALVATVKVLKPGQKSAVTVLRKGAETTLDFVPSEWPEPWGAQNNSFAKIPDLGLTLAALTPKVREQFGLRWGSTGVVITLIDGDRAGAVIERMDVVRGEVIVQVNQADVWRPAQIAKAYQDAKAAGRPHLLLLVEGTEGKRNGYRFSLLPVK